MAPFQRISVWFRGLENKKALAIAAMPAGQEYSKEVTGGASVALGRQQETWGVWGGGGQAAGWKAKGEGWLPGLVADGRASFGQSLPQRPRATQGRDNNTAQTHTAQEHTQQGEIALEAECILNTKKTRGLRKPNHTPDHVLVKKQKRTGFELRMAALSGFSNTHQWSPALPSPASDGTRPSWFQP